MDGRPNPRVVERSALQTRVAGLLTERGTSRRTTIKRMIPIGRSGFRLPSGLSSRWSSHGTETRMLASGATFEAPVSVSVSRPPMPCRSREIQVRPEGSSRISTRWAPRRQATQPSATLIPPPEPGGTTSHGERTSRARPSGVRTRSASDSRLLCADLGSPGGTSSASKTSPYCIGSRAARSRTAVRTAGSNSRSSSAGSPSSHPVTMSSFIAQPSRPTSYGSEASRLGEFGEDSESIRRSRRPRPARPSSRPCWPTRADPSGGCGSSGRATTAGGSRSSRGSSSPRGADPVPKPLQNHLRIAKSRKSSTVS